MATRSHEKAACPLCSQTRRAFNLPAHMLTAHPAEMRIKPFNTGHCVYAAVGEMDFCLCLTCKKGFIGDGSEPNQQRWITLHGKNAECRSAHAAALASFNQATGHQPVPAPVMHQMPALPGIDAVWDECKADTRLRPVMTEVEEFCREMDEVFDVKEGVKQLARSVVGYKKEVAMTKAQMTQMVQAHEHELTEQRVVIHQMKFASEGLQSCIRQLKYENAETRGEVSTLQQRIAQLEKELADIKQAVSA
jgi:hypothetical protein